MSSELHMAVRDLAEEVADVRSHLPRVGALEHREIMLSAGLARVEAALNGLSDRIYALADTVRAGDQAVLARLDQLLGGPR